VCSAKDVVRVLRRHGFVFIDQRGSHQKWRHANGRQVIVVPTLDANRGRGLRDRAWPEGLAQGPRAMARSHVRMHKTPFTDSVWTTKEVHVKFLRPDLAVARVLWSTTGDKVRHVKHGEPREGIFTWIVEKRDGQWLIIASQNTESMPVLPGQ
jgi:uncharacterized protein (TIGR02246 family)